jgi:CHAT domain-containing protein/Tfp pilus assembly protein PilF
MLRLRMTRVVGCGCVTVATAMLLAIPLGAIDDPVSRLELGTAVERALSGGESHPYSIALRAGECAVLTLDQRGVDVVIRVVDATGTAVAEFNSESRRDGQEHAEFVAEEAASYQVAVSARYPRDPAGSYAIHLDAIRRATDRDRALAQAYRLETTIEPLRSAGKYGDAAVTLTEAVQLAERALGADDPYVAALLAKLGTAHRSKGDPQQAEQSFRRALAICEAARGLEHPQTAYTLWLLASLHTAQDDYARAEPMIQQALGIFERTVGADHPLVATALSDLADLHSYRGDEQRARAELERAYAIAERTLEPTDFQRIALVNNLGALYVILKEHDRGEPLLIRALDAIERRFGTDNVRLANPLLNLAIIARERTQFAQALAYLERAYAVRERALGPAHRDTASLLITIGNVHSASGQYALALDAYGRARDVLEVTVGPYHSLTLLTLIGTARSYAAQGDVAHAVESQTRADDVLEKAIAFNLAIGSGRAKLAFLDNVLERTGRTVSLSVGAASGERSAAELSALVLLQRKGRVLDAMTSNTTTLRERLNEGDRRLFDDLATTTSQLATLALQGPGKTPFPDYRQRLTVLEERRGTLEAEASARSSEFRARARPVSVAAVQALIPPEAVLIEFAVYDPFDPKAATEAQAHGEPHYVACVIPREGAVRVKDLGAAKDIDRAVERFRAAMSDPNRDPKPRARALDAIVMAPLRGLVGDGVTRLLLSPDGALNLVPFEALIDEQQRYLIERYAVNYLTTGRDLLRLQVTRSSKADALVVADPLFGEPEQAAATARTGRASARRARRSVVTTDNLSSVYFAPLVSTGSEARAIKSLFPEATLLTGANATKSALTAVEAPRFLHIATHGFFLSANAEVDNPLLRSGLALSGANVSPADRGAGILTALEATNVNLWGTKLVTLSACDTGIGEVKNGEGVYGLRRAFFLAGAETLVMSLWSVTDNVTRDLMSAYYGGLRQGLGRGDALRQAQLALLQRPRTRHPFYWASFIQAGEWANLDGRR